MTTQDGITLKVLHSRADQGVNSLGTCTFIFLNAYIKCEVAAVEWLRYNSVYISDPPFIYHDSFLAINRQLHRDFAHIPFLLSKQTKTVYISNNNKKMVQIH